MDDNGTSVIQPSDKRRSPRRRVLKRARIVFQHGHCSMGCQILNLSDTGALIVPADIILCPKEFVLKPDVGGAREGTQVAVRFI